MKCNKCKQNLNSKELINNLTSRYNNILSNKENIPQTWYTSKTVKKAIVRDLRPIALTSNHKKSVQVLLKTKLKNI